MKKIVLILVMMISFATIAQEKKKSKEYIFKVNGNCEMCEKRIEKAAFSVKGVKSAEWHVDCQDVHVIIDERKCNIEDVKKAVAKAGHDTEDFKATDEDYNNLHGCCHYKRL